MIRFVIVCLLSIAIPQVLSQICGPLNATFEVSPQICKPSYLIPEQYALNNSAGDLLSSALSSLPLPLSHACAEAYSVYFCSLYYPECGADNKSLPLCPSTCTNALTACASESSKFNGTSLYLPRSCDSIDFSNCSATSTVDLSEFYTDCGHAILNKTTFAEVQYILCTPNYTIPAANIAIGSMSYSMAQNIFLTFEYLDQALKGNDSDIGIVDWMYECLKPFAAFYCGQAFPSCTTEQTVPALSVCRSVCAQVAENCANLSSSFNLSSTMLQVPTLNDCIKLSDTDCFTPSQLDTSLAFFFDSDPPTPRITTSTSTSGYSSSEEYSTTVVYPPGGPAAGGGIGAAMIVGLLLIILGISIIMRRQDYK